MSSKNMRYSYISLLNVISCIAVVILHANGDFWNFNSEYWEIKNIIECVFYFAVPVFFMISGATLIGYNERYTTKEYFGKRIKKAVIPFIFWVTARFIHWYFLYEYGKANFKGTVVDYINNLINPEAPYWFFIPLFFIYLAIPCLNYIPKENRNKIFSFIVLITFMCNSLPSFLKDIFSFIDFNEEYFFGIGAGYLFYAVAGYLIKEYQVSRKIECGIYICAVIGVCTHIIGTYVLSMKYGMIIQTYKGYLNVPCILYSIGIFLFFRKYGNKIMNFTFINKFVNIVSKYTFAIFLLHINIMFFIDNIDIHILEGIYYNLLSPFLIIPLCIMVTFILRKIPIIKSIVP